MLNRYNWIGGYGDVIELYKTDASDTGALTGLSKAVVLITPKGRNK